MSRRLLTDVGIFAGLAAAAVVAVVAYQALKAPLQAAPSSNLAPENCSPGPCANLQGFRLWISNVHLEGDLLRMTVKFQNSSAATHASPEDLQLIDASRRISGLATDAAGCNTWTRHEFTNSAYFGPIDICFRVTNTTPPFLLRWAPDLGAFSPETEIKIYTT